MTMKKAIFLLGISLSATWMFSLPASADEFLGRVVKVNAGNRLEVLRDGRRQHIRLYGVACDPGAKGDPARQFMQQLTDARSVYIQPLRADRHGSTIARVQFIGGVNLSHELLKAGLGTWDKKQAPQARRLKQLEREARVARRGNWATTVAMTDLPHKTTRR